MLSTVNRSFFLLFKLQVMDLQAVRSSCCGAKFQHLDTAGHCTQQGGNWSHRTDPAVLHNGHGVGLFFFGMMAPWSEVLEKIFCQLVLHLSEI